MVLHVIPISDSEKHDPSTTCDCKPSVEFLDDGDMMVTHWAFEDIGQKWLVMQETFEYERN